jgi:hypothetical protein
MNEQTSASEAGGRGSGRRRLGRDRWAELVAEQASSGLSAAAFCRERGLAYATFQSWKRRLRREASDGKQPTGAGFVRLEPQEGAAGSVEAELPCGTRVRVEVEQLGALIHALRREGGSC